MTITIVPEIEPSVSYQGNGSNQTFSYTFPVRNSAELKVYVNNSLIAPDAYIITGLNTNDGGDVIFDVAPGNGLTVKLERVTVLDRSENYSTHGVVRPLAIDAEFSKITMILQELDKRLDTVVPGSSAPAPILEYVTPGQFGAAGNGTTDDSTAVEAFLNALITSGKRGRLENKTYRVTRDIAPLTGSFYIEGPGTFFIDYDPTNTDFLRFRAERLVEFGVSAVTNGVSHTFAGASGPTIISTLTLPSGHSIVAGDFLKIFSDDSIAHAGTNGKAGEFCYVVEVSGTTARLSSNLRYGTQYVTNVRVSKFNPNAVFYMRDVRFTATFSAITANSRKYTTLSVRNYIRPHIIDCKFFYISDLALDLRNCFGADISRCEFFRGYNNTNLSPTIAGVGIQDANSAASQINDCLFRDLRRAYTTSTASTPVDWEEFGCVLGSIVSQCIAANCSASPYSTQAGSDNIQFVACRSYQNYIGTNSNDAGWQLNGINHTLTACNNVGGRGVTIRADNTGEGIGHTIEDFNHDGDGYGIDAAEDGTPLNITISGGKYTTKTNWIFAKNATIKVINRPRVVVLGTAVGVGAFRLEGSTNILVHGLHIDASAYAQTTFRLISYISTGNVFDGRDIDVQRGAAWTALVSGDGNSATMYMRVRTDFAPGARTTGTAGSMYTSFDVNDRRNTSSTRLTRADSDTILDTESEWGQSINVIYTLTANTTITSANAGKFVGQTLFLFNSETSGGTLTVNNNTAGNLALGANQTVGAGAGITLVWDSNGSGTDHWRLASAAVTASVSGTQVDIQEQAVNVVINTDIINFTGADFDVSTTAISLASAVIKTPLTQNLDADGFQIIEPDLKAYDLVDNAFTHGSAGSLTVDYNNGNAQKVSVGANITGLTVSNAESSVFNELLLALNFTATSTVTFGTAAEWGAAGVPTNYSTGVAAGTVDLVQLVRFSAATKWAASAVQGFTTSIVS